MIDRITALLMDKAVELIGIALLLLAIGGYFGYVHISRALTIPEPVQRPDAMLPSLDEYNRLQHNPDKTGQ